MSFFDEVKEIVDGIYNHLPEFGTTKFYDFVADSQVVLFGEILRDTSWKKSNVVKIANVGTAATDLKEIYLSPNLFSHKWFNTISQTEISERYLSSLSISIVNGFTEHECLHILLSSPSLFKNLDSHKKRILESGNKFDESVYKNLTNVIEDIRINNYGVDRFSNVSVFLRIALAFMFNNSLYEMFKEDYENKPTVENIIGLLQLLSNDSMNHDFLYKEFPEECEVINSVSGDVGVREVKNAATKLYILVMNRVDEDEQGSEGNEGSEDGEAGSDGQASFDDAPGVVEYDDLDKCAGNISKREKKEIADSFNDRENREKDREEAKKLNLIDDNERYSDYFFVDILEHNAGLRKLLRLPSNHHFKFFGEILKASREYRGYNGIPKDSGYRVVRSRLHRITTDGKIFEDRSKRRINRNPPQVIMIGDGSGSMFDKQLHEHNCTLFDYTCGTLQDGHVSLMNAKIPNSVYIHSTRSFSSTSSIFAISSFDMPLYGGKQLITTTNYKERFRNTAKIDSNKNCDWFVLNHLSQFFDERTENKFILIFSDGLPSVPPPRYISDDNAKDHTKKTVDQIRKTGKHVISFSLVKSVVENNNYIYGSEFNIPAYDNSLSDKLMIVLDNIGVNY
jgi:hypothetical protein